MASRRGKHVAHWATCTDAPPLSITLMITLSTLVVGWLVLILAIGSLHFVVLAPTAKAGVEVILAVSSLFGALVLSLFSEEDTRLRLRWITCGFLILGLSGFGFGYLQPLLSDDLHRNTAMYVSLIIQTIVGILFTAGLLPEAPWRVPNHWMWSLVVGSLLLGIIAYEFVAALPVLTTVPNLADAVAGDSVVHPGLTGWHWTLSSIPVILALTAVAGAIRHYPGHGLGGWLAGAFVLRVGAQLHGMFWPSSYSPVLTTSSLLRIGFTAIVVAGGVVELRRIAIERTALLAAEREYSSRMREVSILKADFTAMVGHELSAPIGAIRRLTEIAGIGELQPHQEGALQAIHTELGVLTTLVADVRASAAVERDDFSVQLHSTPLTTLLVEAATFGSTLPGHHPIHTALERPLAVEADPERINQVLRNLLSNAAKYSPDGTPITLRAVEDYGLVRIDVIDQGVGIHTDDLRRVLEKFGRGRQGSDMIVPGVGLGLYLSRRIIQAHGSDLTIDSALGYGTTVSFRLRHAPAPGHL